MEIENISASALIGGFVFPLRPIIAAPARLSRQSAGKSRAARFCGQ
jgi:hypothetical protein